MASDQQTTTDLDWGEATVSGGTLELPLTQKASKRWVEEVTSVLDRLGPKAGVEVGREKLTVAVAEGEERDVRHLLESAVLEANSRLAPAEEEDGDDDDARAEDVAMTETFRAFAADDAS